MASTSISSNMNQSRRSEERDDQPKSRLEAVREYEGDGAGTVINEHYSQEEYSKRRLGFLSRHPDYKDALKLAPKVRRDAEEVFISNQPATLSVQEIRKRELEYDIDPLLPFPTSENTQTIDDHSTYPTTEWTSGMATDQVEILQQTRSYTSPSPPPGIMAAPETHGPDKTTGQVLPSGYARPAGTPPIVAERIDSVRNSPKQQVYQASATVSERSTETGNSTQSNLSDNNHPGGEIDRPQQTANTSPDRATSNTSPRASNTGPASNDMASMVLKNPPTREELDNVLEMLARPPTRNNGIGAVAGRPVDVPVKPQGTKRPAPPDTNETDESAPQATAPPSPKKVKLNPPKAPSAAEPAPPAPSTDREDAVMSDPTAPAASSSRRKKATTNGIPISSDASDVAAGAALPRDAKTAKAAQTLRRQQLAEQRKSRRSGMRATDPKPEFWLKENITAYEHDNLGPVRCVCGTWAHDGTVDDGYAGCEKAGCLSWQHVACVGEAFKGEDKRYGCHQCDPYAHRRVLQKIRAGEEIERAE
ncbi:hypothetical protein CLAFUW4_04856 [Fulvia fulva]|uniref:Zinc finger PHD-type domain-containing protein n=1 Tax=Passalora fulva TaxID=5499 RepID=A0A9Q8UUM9_PASFU|nr:uncharacterized protein CLAFUR5_12049 [Fulvia fulva]KAK4627039.1 hypothetical protein CLAFUR4_04842 [Fulvia fulva]KAK4627723.1 hypothetical protein CLAFUR0_04846 [Fulvia fulva]UJO23078.1 hypothetical protein CLAFUR5_12049 [Fulvia fulva]WPV14404.1 hypothetical protein CLAFUW4_04856 [Fulvia fulva]WPV28985.1 hypothetical protein CLAFUW7_04850 [Fulvia fulva]